VLVAQSSKQAKKLKMGKKKDNTHMRVIKSQTPTKKTVFGRNVPEPARRMEIPAKAKPNAKSSGGAWSQT
jgi:hypothetical protein